MLVLTKSFKAFELLSTLNGRSETNFRVVLQQFIYIATETKCLLFHCSPGEHGEINVCPLYAWQILFGSCSALSMKRVASDKLHSEYIKIEFL